MADAITCEIIGLPEMLAQLAALAIETRLRAEEAVTGATEDAYDASLPLIPVLTGFLLSRQQIQAVNEGSTIMHALYNDADYALFVNEGHHTRSGSWVPAQDFMTGPMLIGQKSLERRCANIFGA